MKKFWCALLVMAMLLSCAAADVTYTIPEKMFLQAIRGSGVKGSMTLRTVKG